MAFEFDHDETIDRAAGRIAAEQVGAALGWLDVAAGGPDPAAGGGSVGAVADFVAGEVDTDASVEEAVHEARKCCKRVRGLARLVRPALGKAYRATNTTVRDAARELAPIRDAHALLATFDDLVATIDRLPAPGLVEVRAGLVARAAHASETGTTNLDRIAAARRRLGEVRDGIAGWPLEGHDAHELVDAVAAGIAKTAGRARKQFAKTAASDAAAPDEVLHEWRKRVKYSWYHVSLLEPAAPTLLGVLADLYHDLSDVLGDDHDLAVLTTTLTATPDEFGGPAEVAAAEALMNVERRDLQRRAIGVGGRLHAEEPEALGRRLTALLEAWWIHGPEPRAGEIADLHDVADDLGDRTTGQLRELARRHGLPGRSRLDRAGLLGALRAAGATE